MRNLLYISIFFLDITIFHVKKTMFHAADDSFGEISDKLKVLCQSDTIKQNGGTL